MESTEHNDAPDTARGEPTRKVALFVTCLADIMRPSVAQATLTLLEQAGCEVSVPIEQTCCGQPGYNSGDYAGAQAIARQVIRRFEAFDYVVLPSGSCAGMMIRHYPKLFGEALEKEWLERAQRFAPRVYELTQFLVDVCDYRPAKRTRPLNVAYHDACAGLRELGIREQPRRLLASAGVVVSELAQGDVCCGFGGTFCAKMPAISADMADQKLRDIQSSIGNTVDSGVPGGANTGEPNTLLAGDLGCLLALAGRARRTGVDLQCRHIAEILVGDSTVAAIAAPTLRTPPNSSRR